MKFLVHKNGTLLGQIVTEPGRDPEIDECLWGIIPRLSRGVFPFIDPVGFHDLLDRLTGCHLVIEGHGCIFVTQTDTVTGVSQEAPAALQRGSSPPWTPGRSGTA